MKIKQPSAVDQVFHSLMVLIRNQEPGTRLPPQDVLAKKFYVSRTVLREAISMLLVRNIVTVRPKIGTVINPHSEWLVLIPQSANNEIQEILKILEIFMTNYRSNGWENHTEYAYAEELLASFTLKSVQ